MAVGEKAKSPKAKNHFEFELMSLLEAVADDGWVVVSRARLARIYGLEKITKTVWRDLGNRWDGIVKNSSHKGSKLYSWHEAGERLILIRQKKFDDSGDDSIMSVTERMK